MSQPRCIVSLKSPCITASNIDPQLLSDWNALDANRCTNPNTQSGPLGSPSGGCQDFYKFISNWGTHFISGVTSGVEMNFFSATQSSQSYSQTDMKANFCANYAGVGVTAGVCGGFDSATTSSASKLQITTSKTIVGGNRTIQSKIIGNLALDTADDITAYLLSATNQATSASIGYKFVTLWDRLNSVANNQGAVNVFGNLLSTGFLANPKKLGEPHIT